MFSSFRWNCNFRNDSDGYVVKRLDRIVLMNITTEAKKVFTPGAITWLTLGR